MKVYFFIFLLVFCSVKSTWAQLHSVPLQWYEASESRARTEATTPYVDTLKLPYFYDFDSRYLQIDTVIGHQTYVATRRPHGLVDKDSVNVQAAFTYTNGTKYVKKLSNYDFNLYLDSGLNTPDTITFPPFTLSFRPYLRINKIGAKVTQIPDTLAFYYNAGGVIVNGGYAKTQPSYYVASFDGLNQNGDPYNSTNQFAVGYTDSLYSQRFDLSTYATTSKLYMSFSYQHGGYGEQPDAGDHLYLEFLDKSNVWHSVYTASSIGSTDSFYIAMVPISDTIYLHDHFQYKFRSYGRQSGSYDVWNIDYIYLNKNRTIADSTLYDYAIRDSEHSFLKGFQAMPFTHFFKKPSAHIKDSLYMVLTNQNPVGRLRTPALEINDSFNNQILYTQLSNDNSTIHDKTYYFKTAGFSFPVSNKAMIVEQVFGITDNQQIDYNDATKNFDLMFNNFLTKKTYLYDYYAYDDSEAESGFGTNQAGTKIAIRFVAQAKDTLTHIDMCFTRNKDLNLEGSQIFLMVWKDTIVKDTTQYAYKRPINIHYQTTPNAFTRYELATPIPLDSGEVYYIGYLQNLPYLLTFGYDKNNDALPNTYYNESNQWIQASSDPTVGDPGSMMIRPVFYKLSNGIPLSITNPVNNTIKNGLLIYPNPTSSSIHVLLKDNISPLQYTIHSLYGQLLYQGEITPEENEILLSNLSSGMYLITCTDIERRTYSSRFIKE